MSFSTAPLDSAQRQRFRLLVTAVDTSIFDIGERAAWETLVAAAQANETALTNFPTVLSAAIAALPLSASSKSKIGNTFRSLIDDSRLLPTDSNNPLGETSPDTLYVIAAFGGFVVAMGVTWYLVK